MSDKFGLGNQPPQYRLELEESSSEEDDPNTPPSILPLMYTNPADKNVYWICDYDGDRRITSMFTGHGDRYSAYMDSEVDALRQEDMLVNAGWVRCKKPEITITHEGGHHTVPRKVKRKRERMAKNDEKRKAKREGV